MSHSINRQPSISPESVRTYLNEILASLSPEEALRVLKNLKKVVIKICDKGGIVVVSDGDVVITSYRYDSYKRR